MTKIRGVVEKITYQNPENGYSVLRVAVKGYNELVTVVGNLVDANVGSVLLIEGDWKVDKKYGSQFIAQKWEETVPATVFGIEKYLGSGLVKGVGPKFAKRIVNLFGMDTISVIEDDPERLNEVDGIGKKRVEMIVKSWEQQKEIKNIMLFLQGHDVSTSFAAKIYKTQGSEYLVVVMPVMMTHFMMLQRNLVYTGITRAKKMLVLVGTKKAISYAVKHVTVTKQNTKLKERLKEI